MKREDHHLLHRHLQAACSRVIRWHEALHSLRLSQLQLQLSEVVLGRNKVQGHIAMFEAGGRRNGDH